ncbi:MAG: lipid A hydroxylase LpxO [Pseudomonadota bacterium]
MKWWFVGLYLSSVLFVHFRGRARLPFLRQLFDHSTFMAPINMAMYVLSKVSSTAYVPVQNFAELAILQQNWQLIRTEALHLLATQKIRAAAQNNDAGFNSFFKTGWKRFYLKWYDASHPSAQELCPQTYALLKSLPSVKAAMFAELPPGAVLNPHRDPFAGSLRYHLGLVTPNDDACFIEVNQQRYSWRDGEAVMFDETYIHWAKNGSDANRIILFCDVERPMRFAWAQSLNRWLGRTMMTAASSPNDTGDDTGGINKLFHLAWSAGQYRRRFKQWNRTVYLCTKVLLIALAIFLVIKL